MLLETNIFVKMSNFWMNTPKFPAMYMETLLLPGNQIKIKT